MKIVSLPKDVLAELLRYLADHSTAEEFGPILGGDFSLEGGRAALRELAVQLVHELEIEREQSNPTVDSTVFSSQTRKILSSLTPRDEKNLLKAFGFFDN